MLAGPCVTVTQYGMSRAIPAAVCTYVVRDMVMNMYVRVWNGVTYGSLWLHLSTSSVRVLPRTLISNLLHYFLLIPYNTWIVDLNGNS